MNNSKQFAQVRCAIYTRKSTEEGLDQDFNSLHAQREAAEAYIKSQKHQGWTIAPQPYDDGGYTGGNLDRPALKQLMTDIDSGRIQCVVVYKVDRLSRSLLDFARLMDRFDQRQVSFVSVTQQFNTTASLGRLTLNILLSFAQFEREIIGERTRDKMSAARRKGKWTGGMPVLGYDVDPRGGSLIVNPSEAAQVQEIFRLYRQSSSVSEVLTTITEKGWTTKSWTTRMGTLRQGQPFTPSTLRRLLGNPLYTGRVRHKGVIYPGEHAAIIQADLWEQVNAVLTDCGRGARSIGNTTQQALLKGLLFCGSCNEPMLPSYATKRDRRYPYYVCRTARRNGWAACPVKTISAARIEESVIQQLQLSLQDERMLSELGISRRERAAFEGRDASTLISEFVEKVIVGHTGRVTLELQRKNS